MTPVIGLTGQIGAGKSTAAGRFAELGAEVVDADRVGHQTLDDPNIRRRLIETFGETIAANDGSIDRKKLGAIVFNDPQSRKRLEETVHPEMRRRFVRRIEQARADGRPTVLDAAILYEAGWDDLCDRVLVVVAPWEIRLARLNASRGFSAEDLRKRESAQAPIDEKTRRADAVIENAGAPAKCFEQVDGLFRNWAGEEARLRAEDFRS